MRRGENKSSISKSVMKQHFQIWGEADLKLSGILFIALSLIVKKRKICLPIGKQMNKVLKMEY